MQFLVDNYSAAATVATEVDRDFKMNIDAGFVLGWSQAENGNGLVPMGRSDSPNSSVVQGNSYFNQRGGIGSLPCRSLFACFPSYQAAAESAFYGGLLISGYGGNNGWQVLSAAYILADQFAHGASYATALQAAAGSGRNKGGFDPGNKNYGQAAANAIQGTKVRLDCLKAHGYI